ncbi:MAG: hypothetical protein R3C12_19485 [Planctomycetaceae bacterium]
MFRDFYCRLGMQGHTQATGLEGTGALSDRKLIHSVVNGSPVC